MAKKAIVLSEGDAAILQGIIDRVKRDRVPRAATQDADDECLTPEVYQAKVPTAGLPAGVQGGLLGQAECEIYRAVRDVLEATGLRKVVYNAGPAVAADTFVRIDRDKFGVWFVSPSASAFTVGEVDTAHQVPVSYETSQLLFGVQEGFYVQDYFGQKEVHLKPASFTDWGVVTSGPDPQNIGGVKGFGNQVHLYDGAISDNSVIVFVEATVGLSGVFNDTPGFVIHSWKGVDLERVDRYFSTYLSGEYHSAILSWVSSAGAGGNIWLEMGPVGALGGATPSAGAGLILRGRWQSGRASYCVGEATTEGTIGVGLWQTFDLQNKNDTGGTRLVFAGGILTYTEQLTDTGGTTTTAPATTTAPPTTTQGATTTTAPAGAGGGLAGTVFNDTNANNTFELGTDPGVSGVLVEVLQGGTVINSATTPTSGQYSFSIPSGTTATVRITVPTGYTSCSATSVNVTLTAGSNTIVNFCLRAVPPAPTITALSPGGGPRAGGTSVSITGTNFTGATAVVFGTLAAASFTVNSATSITAVSPAAGAPGSYPVAVTTSGGTSNAFPYTMS